MSNWILVHSSSLLPFNGVIYPHLLPHDIAMPMGSLGKEDIPDVLIWGLAT